jgi:glycine/D-amino acid oxidase-like deaminating enzyme/nitrite reductase/ring-hydroxylating ferredoxin subunit
VGSLDEVHPSIWVATSPATDFGPLQGELEVDVAVIGAGITGLSAALLLTQAGLGVAVVEAGAICSGTTGYTTAKLSSLHGLTYADIAKDHGEEHARLYGEAAQSAIERVAALVAEHGIECDFERMPAFTYTQDAERVGDIEREVEAAQHAGLPASFTTQTDLPYEVRAAIRFEDQAVVHPRKYCAALAHLVVDAGGQVFESTRARGIESGDPHIVKTPAGRVVAGHVIQATQLPFQDPGGLFARTAPMRSYCLAARHAVQAPEGMYLSADTPTRSVRPHRDGDRTYLVLGGEGHKVGQESDTDRHYAALEAWARASFGLETIEYRWSAQDYVPVDGVPYIGKLSAGSDGLWVATGFKKWGMTTGVVAAVVLRDLILERDNPWAEVFDATRLKLGASAKKLLKENANVAKRFVGDRMRSVTAPDVSELGPGEGAVARVAGEPVAAYRDDEGRLHGVSPTCTHLGCVVAFNRAERTWDCPCHGSRFGIDGAVIQGPAIDDLDRVELGSSTSPTAS